MITTALIAASLLASGGGSFAIVVGYNQGTGPKETTLRYADDDAIQYARLFEDLGSEVRLLVEMDEETRRLYPNPPPHRSPTLSNVSDALDDFDRWKARRNRTTLYFVYAGHGDVRRGEG
ncbi:MAG: caspase family protein [Myxococcota bacterium]